MRLKSVLSLLALSQAALFLASCETTGDPNSGGIFWSENKAQHRQAVLQNELQDARSENARLRHKSAELESRQ